MGSTTKKKKKRRFGSQEARTKGLKKYQREVRQLMAQHKVTRKEALAMRKQTNSKEPVETMTNKLTPVRAVEDDPPQAYFADALADIKTARNYVSTLCGFDNARRAIDALEAAQL